MKRLFIAIALIAIALTLSTLEYIYVTKTYDRCITQIDKSYHYFSDKEYSYAYKLCKNAENIWNDSAKIMSFFLVHSQIYNVSSDICELKNCAKNKEEIEFETLYNKTKRQLLSIKKSELPDLENIL